MAPRLVDIDEAPRPARRLTALDVARTLGRIIEEWAAPCIEPGSEGYAEVYWSLRALGAPRIALGKGCEASLDELGVFEDLSERPAGEVYSSPLDLALRARPTPLVKLRWSPARGVRVWAKLEWFNPLSLSVKDRPALHILLEARLPPGSRVGDASSSNFAAAVSAASAILGLKARVYLPGATGRIGKAASMAFGAEVVVDEDASGTTDLVKRVAEDSKKLGFVHLNQFTNDLNFESHLRGVAREIDFQARTAGLKLRGAAGSLGTSGHMAAVSFYLSRRLRGDVDIVLAQPARGDVIPGLRRVETGMLWLNILDIDYTLYDVAFDDAMEALVEVARSDGLLVSPSAGAALAALRAHLEAGEGLEGDYIVVVPDTGYKYLDLIERWLEGRLGEG
jgi:cysteine synthase/O-phosphoserine sulfhydrylase/cystathionine beta-synthase